MTREEIEKYIAKLSLIEKELSDDDTLDFQYVQELDSLLGNLRSDIMVAQNQSKGDQSSNLNLNISPTIEIRIKKLHENAIIPKYAKDGDAGMDLTATEIISESTEQITYGTGISLEIPKGYVGLVFPRSSIKKYELELTNSVGVIDSGYRGEIQATFNKVHHKLKKYDVGDRMAQIIILPYPKIEFIESDELSNSDRGTGGFGSTGT